MKRNWSYFTVLTVKELSRRDDLENLGYVLLYLAKGTLPWMQFMKEDVEMDEFFKLCGSMKQELTSQTLCQGLPG